MVDSFSSLSTTCLTEISFIGGSYKELGFKVFDASGSPINISSFTYRWILSPYGQPETSSLVKDGIFDATDPDNNKFKVYLYSYDTVNLSGKYIQQPIVVGSPGYEFRMDQGYINIIPAASLTTVEDTQTLNEQVIQFTQIVSASMVLLQTVMTISSGSILIMPDASGKIGFYGTTPIVKQTGVGTSASSIALALQNLGLISIA